jgi:hypothetical protein
MFFAVGILLTFEVFYGKPSANVVLSQKESPLQSIKHTDHHEWFLNLATGTAGLQQPPITPF